MAASWRGSTGERLFCRAGWLPSLYRSVMGEHAARGRWARSLSVVATVTLTAACALPGHAERRTTTPPSPKVAASVPVETAPVASAPLASAPVASAPVGSGASGSECRVVTRAMAQRLADSPVTLVEDSTVSTPWPHLVSRSRCYWQSTRTSGALVGQILVVDSVPEAHVQYERLAALNIDASLNIAASSNAPILGYPALLVVARDYHPVGAPDPPFTGRVIVLVGSRMVRSLYDAPSADEAMRVSRALAQEIVASL